MGNPTRITTCTDFYATVAQWVERLSEEQEVDRSILSRCTRILAGAPAVGGLPVKELDVGSSPTLPAKKRIVVHGHSRSRHPCLPRHSYIHVHQKCVGLTTIIGSDVDKGVASYSASPVLQNRSIQASCASFVFSQQLEIAGKHAGMTIAYLKRGQWDVGRQPTPEATL